MSINQPDGRAAWIRRRAQTTFAHLSAAQFDKAYATPENADCVTRFLDDSGVSTIVFSDKLVASHALTQRGAIERRGGKWLAVVKVTRNGEPLDETRLDEQLLVHEVPASLGPMGQLDRTSHDVLLPLISNARNHENCGEVAAAAIVERLHSFLSCVTMTTGAINDDTTLPLPAPLPPGTNAEVQQRQISAKSDNSAGGAPVGESKGRVRMLEEALTSWSTQIKRLLRLDPAAELNAGLHPTPDREIEFWRSKSSHLNVVYEQLMSNDMRRLYGALQRAGSALCAPFAELLQQLVAARREANDNAKYLRTLTEGAGGTVSGGGSGLLTELLATRFEALPEVYQPLLHAILLIWKNSKHYNRPELLLVLIRQICNAIIEKAGEQLNGGQVFNFIAKEEPQNAVKELRRISSVCMRFKEVFVEFRFSVSVECANNPWTMPDALLFVRLDAFLDRTADIEELVQTIIQFTQLAKVQVGGTKGGMLTQAVQSIAADFGKAWRRFEGVDYDVLDVSATQFDDDFFFFRRQVAELEQRLVAVAIQAFDDCNNIMARFKALESFGVLLHRPSIKAELAHKQLELVDSFQREVEAAQHFFVTKAPTLEEDVASGRHQNAEEGPTTQNVPYVIGALYWTKALKDRIRRPWLRLQEFEGSLGEHKEFRDAKAFYNDLMGALDEFDRKKVEDWSRDLELLCQHKLEMPLLAYGNAIAPGKQALRVNFDAALTKLLREVHFLLLLEIDDVVPRSIRDLHLRAENFRRHTASLDLVVHMYNTMLYQLKPVERPLLEPFFIKLGAQLQGGIGDNGLNWTSEDIGDFVSCATAQTKEVHDIFLTLNDNLKQIQIKLDSFSAELLVRHTEPLAPKDYAAELAPLVKAREARVKEASTAIHRLLKSSYDALKVHGKLAIAAVQWESYVEFVSNIVVEGLAKAVRASLRDLLDQIDPTHQDDDVQCPMLRVEMHLGISGKEEGVHFVPRIEHIATATVSTNGGDGDSHQEGLEMTLREITRSWILHFYSIGQLLKRVDGEGSYVRELNHDTQCRALLSQVNEQLATNESHCAELRGTFEKFQSLWIDDMNATFTAFVDDAQETDNDGEVLSLDLPKFAEQLDVLAMKRKEVQSINPVHNIGWLYVSTSPVKEAISTWILRWEQMYTGYIADYAVKKLSGLDELIRKSNVELNEEAGEAAQTDPAVLEAVLQRVLEVEKRRPIVDSMFDPLRQALKMLKSHGVSIGDSKIGEYSVQDYLEMMAESEWKKLIEIRMKRVREQIEPAKVKKKKELKDEIDSFDRSVRAWREDWFAQVPGPRLFDKPVAAAFEVISIFEAQAHERAEDARTYLYRQDLYGFEGASINHKPRKIIDDLLKNMSVTRSFWDVFEIVTRTFESWRPILWSEINTEKLSEACKDFARDVKAFGKQNAEVTTWDMFTKLTAKVSNMDLTMDLISSLNDQALRPRHWAKLSKAVDPSGEALIDPDNAAFCLDTLLHLELHAHQDDVEEVVTTAKKELTVEKKLAKINQVWYEMSLEWISYNGTETRLMKMSEELDEALESHSLELSAMAAMGKYAAHFQGDLHDWQTKLGDVENVTRVWNIVQKNWSSMESIFMASEDIRAQLPEDTKRFEGIDAEFKDFLREVFGDEGISVPNAVAVCTVGGRAETLTGLLAKLDLCEKSLNNYLAVKKKTFPRFYFLSNTAVLQVLANGNCPPKIMQYLSDCFPDALSDLIREEGSNTLAIEMVAKDGERIAAPHFAPYRMEGAVEVWLNGLTEQMRRTLRSVANEASDTCAVWDAPGEEPLGESSLSLPRHEWLFHYPAQIVLAITAWVWTIESEEALEDFENGTEDSVKDWLARCNEQLGELIKKVRGDLERDNRTKIISLITMDVHARDVVQKLIDQKTEGPSAFLWQQQLRLYWDNDTYDFDIKITDFHCKYFYEWVGNTGRLVITPLTDRCYITLTMALRLFLGGAPAGPAGTGKTETTKDLARALAVPCYVFNCSDQMNYKSMANTFKGLCQVGAWGCFDEFNRISVEVLSVIATQVKTIQDAIVLNAEPTRRAVKYQDLPEGTPPVKVGEFFFMDDTISLVPTCGFWITMNPGYAGRAELPENLKVLFRSCAMIRPDFKPICENMLLSEGFMTARVLAIKFVTLYELSRDLLQAGKQHYDWGLRAIKSVLRVAGNLKRAEPNRPEGEVLMRALRDFNIPKIPGEDEPIFRALIDDLFVAMHVPPMVNHELQEKTRAVAKEEKLQATDKFVLKVCQYQELIDVRHSVMLLGPANCGKTTIWKTLCNTKNIAERQIDAAASLSTDPSQRRRSVDQAFYVPPSKRVCVCEPLNPKAITSDELYGCMSLGGDWKDGALSIIMRGMSKCSKEQGFHEYQSNKWVVLDGDIDAIWIESMNTVMDDNKVLTLVSNERILLSPAMRMIFEINSLANATPATVSRAGILFINESDIGWQPFVRSWIEQRSDSIERTVLPELFAKHIPAIHDALRKGFEPVTPLRLISKVKTLCAMLEALFDVMEDAKGELNIACCFAYALMWSFGGALDTDKRIAFQEAFMDNFSAEKGSAVAYPETDSCFDHFYDTQQGCFRTWTQYVEESLPAAMRYSPPDLTDPQNPFYSLIVPTCDTVRLSTILGSLVGQNRSVMFVGLAGTGKTTVISNFLRDLDESMQSTIVAMNYFTDSAKLQQQIEGPIDRRAGRCVFGPPVGKTHIYFLDDVNLPYVEDYGTQNAHALIAQHQDHGTIFDRDDLSFRKEIKGTMYLAAMNPTAGSFTINERNQGHFSTFSCVMPGPADLRTIFNSILSGHLMDFEDAVIEVCSSIVDATVELTSRISKTFLPSARKNVYNWNVRELAAIFQGLTLSTKENFRTKTAFCRLWVHESTRVFRDRMFEEDWSKFESCLMDVVKKLKLVPAKEIPAVIVAKDTNSDACMIYSKFHDANGHYVAVDGYGALRETLEQQLTEYNDSGAASMPLVLFRDAMEHVTRIARIISNPGGNALLLGVGGSGKQSLARLACFICGFLTKQLSVTSRFKLDDLKEALREMYKACLAPKGKPIVWLMTDQQIVNEEFLVPINDILSQGFVSDLFDRGEIDSLINGVRNLAKAAHIEESTEALLDFLMKRAREMFHLVLCFSPSGNAYRTRTRRFPGLVNCVVIDRFVDWPQDAMESVAGRFLSNIQLIDTPAQPEMVEYKDDENIDKTEARVCDEDEMKGESGDKTAPDVDAVGNNEPAAVAQVAEVASAIHGNNSAEAKAMQDAIAKHMAKVHAMVQSRSQYFLKTQRRYNYVTPKSFLSFIEFYQDLLSQKREKDEEQLETIMYGLQCIEGIEHNIDRLKENLAVILEQVAEKVAAANKVKAEVEMATIDANEQKEKAAKENAAAKIASEKAGKIAAEATAELDKAQPMVDAAKSALDGLAKKDLDELKANKKDPNPLIIGCFRCTMIMLAEEYSKKKNSNWGNIKKTVLTDANRFKNALEDFCNDEKGGFGEWSEPIPHDENGNARGYSKVQTMPDKMVTAMKAVIDEYGDEFTPERLFKVNNAAAGICKYLGAVYSYNRIFVKTKPLMDAKDQAMAEEADAKARVAAAKATVAAVNAKLDELAKALEQATASQEAAEKQKAAEEHKLGMANRLIGALGSSKSNWEAERDEIVARKGRLVGDVLLSSAFCCYTAAFDKPNRDWLITEWMQDIVLRKVPLSDGIDPLDKLMSSAERTAMIADDLPADRISIESGSIIVNTMRWPLIIDPQLQAIKWLRKRYSGGDGSPSGGSDGNAEPPQKLQLMQLTKERWISDLQNCIRNGLPVCIENVKESIDATLDPVLARAVVKLRTGWNINFGGEEIDYDPSFVLFLQTKLTNPHYQPEVAAQCAIVNFIATEEGLEDQLLAKVVAKEMPDLEEEKQMLIATTNRLRAVLAKCKEDLLGKMADLPPDPNDMLSDVELIETLERVNDTAVETDDALREGAAKDDIINKTREVFRPVASEGAMLYFLLAQLDAINPMYQYSLAAFEMYFYKSIVHAPAAPTQDERVVTLCNSLRFIVYQWVHRGLFERDKLIFLAHITFTLMSRKQDESSFDPRLLDFLLKCEKSSFVEQKGSETSPFSWLNDLAWNRVVCLSQLDEFTRFNEDMKEAQPRFREWYNSPNPEKEKMPLDWAALDKTPLLKLLAVRCLRPDRMTTAVRDFVVNCPLLGDGARFAQCDASLNSQAIMDASIVDSTKNTPLYFILSPGANVVKDLDELAIKYGMVQGDDGTYHNVSMGQGQDQVAERRLEEGHRSGHWVILNNVHLMPSWLPTLEKILDEFQQDFSTHDSFRLFLSSDYSNAIPIGILNRSIKITNEPPAGLQANLTRAFCTFSKDQIDDSDAKTKAIVFGLCHFHSVLMERKSFGPLGYNRMYPFSLQDLRDSYTVLCNYLENAGGGKIPWDDLKYLFGEIMYGGHITDDFDRLVATTYLDFYMQDSLLEEMQMFPFAEGEKASFMSPRPTQYERYLQHIRSTLPGETPIAFGLHPNAEIDFRTTQAEVLFSTLVDLQPQTAAGDDDAASPQDVAKGVLLEIKETFGDKKFDLEEINRSFEDELKDPYQIVFLQEIAQINVVVGKLMASLDELALGFAGELTMSESMDALASALFQKRVPAPWSMWPSRRALPSWLDDLGRRIGQLDEWTQQMTLPPVTWLAGLINPQSFLTAICQVSARSNELELDKLTTYTDVLSELRDDMSEPSAHGAYIDGLFLQGARWDVDSCQIEKALPKEMFCPMRVIDVRAMLAENVGTAGVYLCPTYKTVQRGPDFVFCAQLRSKSPPARWVLAGVALVLDSE